jgi:hypothetical protein
MTRPVLPERAWPCMAASRVRKSSVKTGCEANYPPLTGRAALCPPHLEQKTAPSRLLEGLPLLGALQNRSIDKPAGSMSPGLSPHCRCRFTRTKPLGGPRLS